MIPNLYWSSIHLGPLTLQVWGIFVALGIGAAMYVSKRYADSLKLKGEVVVDASFWIILGSLLGSRIFFIITEWQYFASDLVGIFRVWEGGLSVSGGFIGAVIAGIVYFRRRNISIWRYAEVMVYGLPLGLAIGRLGCFFIFDHPGSVTTFFLGEVYYGDGLVHHNHGLYLVLSASLMFMLFIWLRYKGKPQAPYFISIFLIWDGTFRLIADSDRILDSQYGGLTAAQWIGMVMIISGLVIFGQRQNIRKYLLSAK